jgi:hypothetical protein
LSRNHRAEPYEARDPPKRERQMRRLITLILLAGITVTVTGCIVEPGRPGGGWCWWHPYRCR